MAATHADDPEEAARQPLLSDTDHEPDHHPSGNTDNHPAAKKETPHWLEELTCKTPLRFNLTLIVCLVLFALISALLGGDFRTRDGGFKWPWTHEHELTEHPGFWSAEHRLSDQPFCLPEVGLITETHESLDRSRDLFKMIGDDLHQLHGCAVRESPKQQRRNIDLRLSLIQGESFYTRSLATMAHGSGRIDSNGDITITNFTTANTRSPTFRSFKLYNALQRLSIQASRQASRPDSGRASYNDDELVSIEELISALQLNHTRVVPVAGRPPALETTLSDTRHLLQSLLGFHHDTLPPLRAVGLDSLSVRTYFSPYVLTTDGVTASTHSPFTLVRQGLSRHGALSGVGSHGSRVSLQQLDRKLDMLMLSEVFEDSELTIAINIERGLIGVIRSELEPHTGSDECKETHEKVQSTAEWMRVWFSNFVYALDWAQEDAMQKRWAGTYRYLSTNDDVESRFDWIEVDIEIDERVPWITRIEYSPRSNDTLTTLPSVSVLKKYNVGGTSDFLASWTCQHSSANLARCYRPLVGDDDSHCSCPQWGRSGHRVSHYRVGLWPSLVRKADGGRPWTIPPGAIRRDGASYMDQGVGGCPALWNRNREQAVPEMQHLGRCVEFIEGKEQLKWMLPGVVMDRISKW